MDKPIHVLIVDDEPDFLEPLAFWLSSRGYNVSKAPDGEQAIKRVAADCPDIVFLDVNMPGIDGIETLRRLRETNPTLPVLIVTAAYQDEKKFEQARTLGIAGFIPKGSSLPELAKILEVTLRAHGRLKSQSE